MTQKDISIFYKTLTNGEKGMFTAYISCKLGGSPHTWQQKFLGWSKGLTTRRLSPLFQAELSSIIEEERWKSQG